MKGSISSEQRCPVCGNRFVDNHKDGLICLQHQHVRAIKLRVRYPGGIHLRFNNYDTAASVLAGLRWKATEGSLDPRDYRKDQPLGFQNLSAKFIEQKKDERRSWKDMERHLKIASCFFNNRNVKDLNEGDLDDFLRFLPAKLSDKTRYNIMGSVHSFFSWIARREKRRTAQPFEIPEFPKIDFKLKFWKIVDKETQWAILQEVRRISWDKNPKIYLGCLWLATYPEVRPGAMLQIKEKDFDCNSGTVAIYHSYKETEPKRIQMLPEDITAIKAFPTPLHGDMWFFRHESGKRFGKKYWYKHWVEACKNLGIEGVPLYPGTKHSSLTDIRRRFGYSTAKDASGHATNKALDRYIIPDPESRRELYAQMRPGHDLATQLGHAESGKVVEISGK